MDEFILIGFVAEPSSLCPFLCHDSSDGDRHVSLFLAFAHFKVQDRIYQANCRACATHARSAVNQQAVRLALASQFMRHKRRSFSNDGAVGLKILAFRGLEIVPLREVQVLDVVIIANYKFSDHHGGCLIHACALDADILKDFSLTRILGKVGSTVILIACANVAGQCNDKLDIFREDHYQKVVDS